VISNGLDLYGRSMRTISGQCVHVQSMERRLNQSSQGMLRLAHIVANASRIMSHSAFEHASVVVAIISCSLPSLPVR